eukprot:NODE_5097_length_984_cov_111.507549_g4888_i0.p1 GENE.NODE_5097_length_984_cov_111.507549_g4888_i0~~NODE_5097_length_984_cov_111.507549_g4888_i0.p1  ORF type:complete len:203 (+),score=46.77 NODE_5097_length_984_cov_111.507549_g4888_i0:58-609(+)
MAVVQDFVTVPRVALVPKPLLANSTSNKENLVNDAVQSKRRPEGRAFGTALQPRSDVQVVAETHHQEFPRTFEPLLRSPCSTSGAFCPVDPSFHLPTAINELVAFATEMGVNQSPEMIKQRRSSMFDAEDDSELADVVIPMDTDIEQSADSVVITMPAPSEPVKPRFVAGVRNPLGHVLAHMA